MSGAPMDTGSGSSGAGHGSAPPTSLDHDSDSSSLSDVDDDEVLQLLRKEVDEYTKRESAADNEILMDDMLNIPTPSAAPTYSSNTSIFGRHLGPRTQGNIFGPSSGPTMQPVVPETFSFGPSVAPGCGSPPAPSVQPNTPSNNSSASQGNMNMFGLSPGPKNIFGIPPAPSVQPDTPSNNSSTSQGIMNMPGLFPRLNNTFGNLPPPPAQPNPSQHAIPGLFQDSTSTTRGSLFSCLPSVPMPPDTFQQSLPGQHLDPYPTWPSEPNMFDSLGNTLEGSDPWLLANDLEIGHLWNEGHPVNQRPVIQPKSVSRRLPEGTNNSPKITGRLASFIATAGHGSASGTAMTGQMRSSSSENPHSVEICDPVHRPSPEKVTSHQHGRSQSPTAEERDLSMHPPIRRRPPTGAAGIEVQPLTDNPHLECDQRLAAAMRDVSEMREREKEMLTTQLNDMEIDKKKQREDLEELLRRRSSDLRKQHAKDIQELKKELTRKDMVLQSAAAKAHKEGSDAAVRDHAHRYQSMDEALRKREDIVKKKEASEASVVQATRDAIAKKEKELGYKENSLKMREEDLESDRKSFNAQCDALMAEKEQELENLTKISETQQTAARELLATQDAAQKAILERDEKLRSLNTQLVQAQHKLSAAEAKQQQVENQLNVFKAQSYKLMAGRDQELKKLNAELADTRRQLSVTKAQQQEQNNNENSLFKSQFDKAIADREEELKNMKAQLLNTQKFASDEIANKDKALSELNAHLSHINESSQKAIADRDETLRSLNAQLASIQLAVPDAIANKDRALNELNAELSKLQESSQKEIADRDETLKNLSAQLTEIQTAMPDAIAEKDEALSELKTQLSNLHATSQKTIADRDESLKNMNAQLANIQTAAPDSTAGKDDVVKDLTAQLTILQESSQKEIADRDETLKNLSAQLTEIQTAMPDAIAEKDKALSELKTQLSNLHAISQKTITDRDETLKNMNAQLANIQTAAPDSIAEKDKELKDLNAQLTNLQTTSQKAIADREEEVKELKKQLSNAQATESSPGAEKDKALDELNAQLSSLQVTSQKAIADRDEKIDNLTENLLRTQHQAMSRIKESDKKLSEAIAQKKKSHEMSSKAIETLESLHADIVTASEETIARLEQDVANPNKAYEDLDARHARLSKINIKTVAGRDAALDALIKLKSEKETAQKATTDNDKDLLKPSSQLSDVQLATKTARDEEPKNLNAQTLRSQETAQKATAGKDKDLLKLSSQLSDIELQNFYSQAEIISSQIQEASAYKKMCDDQASQLRNETLEYKKKCDDQASQLRNETLEYKKKCDDDVHNQLQEQASAYQKKYDDDFHKLKEEASAIEQKCDNNARHQLQEQASAYQKKYDDDFRKLQEEVSAIEQKCDNNARHQLQEQASTYHKIRDEDVRQQVEYQMKTAKSQFEAEKATYCAQIEKMAQEKWEKIHIDANENYHANLEKRLDKELKVLEEGLKKQASDSAPKDGEERKRLHQQLKDISRKANQLQGDFDRESSRHQVTMDDLVDVRQGKRKLEQRLAFSEKEVSRLLQEIAGHEKAATENSKAWHEENMRILFEHTQSARESKEAREEAFLAHRAAEKAEKAKEAAIKSLKTIKGRYILLQRQLVTMLSIRKATDGRSDTLKGLTVKAGDLLVKEVDLLAPEKGGLNKKKRVGKSSQDILGQIKKGPLASQRDWLRAHPHWQFLLVLLFMTGLLYCIGAGISCLVSWSGAGQEEIWPEEVRHFDLRGGGGSGIVGWMWEDPLLDLSRKGFLR